MPTESDRGNAAQTKVGYCVKCRSKVVITAPKAVVFKTGRHALQGPCPHCGTTVSVIVATPQAA